MNRNQVVIITGMHRSGTSLLASILQEAGVQIGDDLVEPGRGNEYGHFEDVEFFRFHEDLLHRLGQTIFVQHSLEPDVILPEEIERAKRLIETRRSQALWGWKDPRTTLVLEFWRDLIPDARYVLVYRHPLEVNLSILRRGADADVLTNPFAGLKAWEVYNQNLLAFYERHPDKCVLAHIRAITADAPGFVEFVAHKLQLPLRREGTHRLFRPAALKQNEYIQNLSPLLRQVRAETVQLYDQLEAQADLPQNTLSKPAPEGLPAIPDLQKLISQKFDDTAGHDQAVDNFFLLLALLDSRALLKSREQLDNLRVEWMNHARNLEAHARNLEDHVRNLEAHAANLEKFAADLKNEREEQTRYISRLETRNETLLHHLTAIENTKIWRLAKKWYNLKAAVVDRGQAVSRQALPPRLRLWAKFQYQSAQVWRKSGRGQRAWPPHSKPPALAGLKVLMVYPDMGAPTRYRVFNQAAQMKLLDISPLFCQTDELAALDRLSQADLVYLYRVERTPLTNSLVKEANRRHIPVVFDTDDLIWDQRIETYCFLRDHWPDEEVDDFLVSIKRHAEIMEQADYFIVSTPFLAKMAASHFNKKVFVNKNAIDQTAQKVSQPFYQARQEPGLSPASETVTIVYASGWLRAHQEDFAVTVEALGQVLRDRPQVRLKIIGYLDLEGLFPGYEERIEFQEFVDWQKLLEILSKVDINLAPIVTNPQRRSKSAVKFLEAALVGVPTVATNLEPYHDIDHGQTGLLAGSTSEWYDCLIKLVDSPALRSRMGQAAHRKVLACDTVQVRAAQLEKTLHQVIEDYYGGS